MRGVLRELVKLPRETEYVEFKENRYEHEEIGEYISALSNSAALHGKANAYMVWGVEDESHKVVGTSFQPGLQKVGAQEMESWLLNLLSPRIHFYFHELLVDGLRVVILEIARASHKPVQFKNQEFIRIGSYKKKLKEYAEKERALWRIFDQVPFEEVSAKEQVTDVEVLKLLDYPAYFELLGLSLPENRSGILERLAQDEMVQPCDAGGWNITNLGAILFAKDLESFKHLKRKAVRVIVYKDNSRRDTVREKVGNKGYATGFEGLIGYINNLLPSNEVIGQALRKEVPMYPELAVRELVANAIIHQDFFAHGTGPMVEIFPDRMEITNPGAPLVDPARFLDTPPKSRNESLASFMRRIGVCEERGSGVDKVVFETEMYQLPAPLFEVTDEHTRAVLFSHREFREMDKDERIRACYLHCCLRYVNREVMNNSSLRERFAIDERNKAQASRIIKQTLEAGLIKPYDPAAGSKGMRYVPYWS